MMLGDDSVTRSAGRKAWLHPWRCCHRAGVGGEHGALLIVVECSACLPEPSSWWACTPRSPASTGAPSLSDFRDWRRGTRSSPASRSRGTTLHRRCASDQVTGAFVSSGLLPCSGSDRCWAADLPPEDEVGAAPVVLIGAGWRRRSAGTEVWGQPTLDGRPHHRRVVPGFPLSARIFPGPPGHVPSGGGRATASARGSGLGPMASRG
jgi:hypothetical protein